MPPNTPTPNYKGFRFPSEIISHAVWLYFRFSLSFRDVEDQQESEADVYQLIGLMVLGLEGEQIASRVAVLEPFLLSSFALPPPLT